MANNSYIVTFKDGTSDEEIQKAKEQVKSQGGEITQEYSLIKGFACTLPEIHAASFANNPSVEAVEPDAEVRTQ